MRRVWLPTLMEACSVSSTPRSAQKRNSATTTLSMVRMVRRLLRPRLIRISLKTLMAGSSLCLQQAFFQLELPLGVLRGVWIVGHHHNGLLELTVESFQKIQDLLGGLAIEVSGRLV